MAGLVPAIHVFSRCHRKNGDARDKPGHDDRVRMVVSKSPRDYRRVRLQPLES